MRNNESTKIGLNDKIFASVGLTQACPNYATTTTVQCNVYKHAKSRVLIVCQLDVF